MRCLDRTITLFICSGLTAFPTYGNWCLTDADREDGLFCSRKTCNLGTGTCSKIAAYPFVIKEVLSCG
jgi:hypothetical protein